MRRWESIGFVAALVLVSAVAGLAYRSIGSAGDTLAWVEHTHETLQDLADVNAAYARAAAARRSFIIAGDPSQLADAEALDGRMRGAVSVLRRTLADNPAQVRQLDALAILLDRRLRTLDGDVARHRADPTAGETAEGLALTSRIRTSREELEDEENRLLADRDARTRRDIERTRFAVALGVGGSVCILLLAFTHLRREIQRRRRSELALHTSERFLDSIVENLPNMVFVKEAGELRFARINRAGEELLGVTRASLLGKNDYDFFPREQADDFQKRDRETLAAQNMIEIAEEPITAKGVQRWLHTKKVPVLDEHGVPRYLLGISEDITERRAAQEALRKATEATELANRELEAFSYSVAHDLRAPLRAVDGFCLALVEDYSDKLDAEGVDYLRRSRAAAQQMAQLIDGLLGLARVARSAIVRETVNLTQIAKQTGAQLGESEPGRKVELVVQDGLVADGDVRLLRSVLGNLLGNAWKFTSKAAHARIEVGEVRDGGHDLPNGPSSRRMGSMPGIPATSGGPGGVRAANAAMGANGTNGNGAAHTFFVRDNGAGFEQKYADKLFGAFQRLHGTNEFEGTGIGLATVERIVRRHGGRVWAEGEVGRGATIYFTL